MARGEGFEKPRSANLTEFVESTDGSRQTHKNFVGGSSPRGRFSTEIEVGRRDGYLSVFSSRRLRRSLDDNPEIRSEKSV